MLFTILVCLSVLHSCYVDFTDIAGHSFVVDVGKHLERTAVFSCYCALEYFMVLDWGMIGGKDTISTRSPRGNAITL